MKKQGTLAGFFIQKPAVTPSAGPSQAPVLTPVPSPGLAPAPTPAAALEPLEAAFLDDMDEATRGAHALARVMLGSSYDAQRTHGFLRWREAAAKARG